MDERESPRLPDSEYRVHDPERPTPDAIDPGQPGTPGEPGRPPADATVLFDGSGLEHWQDRTGGRPGWELRDGILVVAPGAGDILTREAIGDCHLHLEWAAPRSVDGDGQGRGNSGVFLMDRYEIQVLDCYENETYADGYAGAVYGQHPPKVNACRPPGSWQTYDIVWEGPRFDDDQLVRPAVVTLFHNGVLAHWRTELNGPTAHRAIPEYDPHPPTAPLRLQDHGDRVRFRNIWVRALPGSPGG